MDEARSSWNTTYVTREGFECQITLRDEDEKSLSDRITKILSGILHNGGIPRKRRGFDSENSNSNHNSNHNEEPVQEKTYVDTKGVRRCNLKMTTGRRCNTVVVEKDGKYGRFWSCSNFKEHVAAG